MTTITSAIFTVLGQDIPLAMLTASIPFFAIALFCRIFHTSGEYNG